MDRGTGPRGQTPSDGGMLTSPSRGWGADGGPEGAEVLLGKMSEEGRRKKNNRIISADSVGVREDVRDLEKVNLKLVRQTEKLSQG